MTAARRLRDLWLQQAGSPAAGKTAEDAAAGEPAEHEPDEDRAEEERPNEVDVSQWRGRSTCVPRQWFGPSSKR